MTFFNSGWSIGRQIQMKMHLCCNICIRSRVLYNLLCPVVFKSLKILIKQLQYANFDWYLKVRISDFCLAECVRGFDLAFGAVLLLISFQYQGNLPLGSAMRGQQPLPMTPYHKALALHPFVTVIFHKILKHLEYSKFHDFSFALRCRRHTASFIFWGRVLFQADSVACQLNSYSTVASIS